MPLPTSRCRLAMASGSRLARWARPGAHATTVLRQSEPTMNLSWLGGEVQVIARLEADQLEPTAAQAALTRAIEAHDGSLRAEIELALFD